MGAAVERESAAEWADQHGGMHATSAGGLRKKAQSTAQALRSRAFSFSPCQSQPDRVKIEQYRRGFKCAGRSQQE
jgi:hypothetical protein